jgi:putative ABC transport system permease protein
MNNWLQGFAYRIDLSWWIFALAGLIAIVIALLTISSQSLKVAYANPAESLKNE